MLRSMDPLIAADPRKNATVSASAGTGKTWLLVARMVRLLLAGTPPHGIMAVTFTRKAAGEMRVRLYERLADMAMADEATLDHRLTELGETPSPALRERARHLHEKLLMTPRGPRITTFHAFCQELLARFPIEADVPPGFELMEDTGLLAMTAWDALCAEAAGEPGGTTAEALDTLFAIGSGPDATRDLLMELFRRRADWWAYTSGQTDRIHFATEQLRTLLAIDPAHDPANEFWQAARVPLERIREVLHARGNKADPANVEKLDRAFGETDPAATLELVTPVLLTQAGTIRAEKASNALAKKVGSEAAERFATEFQAAGEALLAARDALLRRENLALNEAWFRAGERLLDHYEKLKTEQRLLDFADLEWRAWRLLHDGEHAEWIQYKLDARIDHLLVDEFQDTNPTQWHLLRPLLEELAAGVDPERPRSVFLVGDPKQSIYRFRRADPRLQTTASEWLHDHIHAHPVTLDRSRRSAPPIITLVNHLFGSAPLAEKLGNFRSHATSREGLPGRVELLPPIEPDRDKGDSRETDDSGWPRLRNPLTEPTPWTTTTRHYAEGLALARRLCALISDGTRIEDDGESRPLHWGDVMLLVRSRNHVADYEQALRDAGIPYIGSERGTLLDSLEVRDLEALLEVLQAPFSDLSLARVLRSPVFAATDEDLIELAGAGTNTTWWERLPDAAAGRPGDDPLARAARLLPHWRTLAGKLPIHDLLDRIQHEGEVAARYHAVTPGHLRARAIANLNRFLELALEVDAGRYPSLVHFLDHLEQLRERASDAPDEPPAAGGRRVRVLTIHAAKGLEAPVVCLADTAADPPGGKGARVLVDWPTEAEQPRRFALLASAKRADGALATVVASENAAEARERANLLYVATTRARQMLLISATMPARGNPDETGDGDRWYPVLRKAMHEAGAAEQEDGALVLGDSLPTSPTAAADATEPGDADAVLPPPVAARADDPPLPSATDNDAVTGHTEPSLALVRGTVLHRMLERLARGEAVASAQALASDCVPQPDNNRLSSWLAEARAAIAHPEMAELFDPDGHDQAWNEVPVSWRDGTGRTISGVIDRLVRQGRQFTIIDYKTHEGVTRDSAESVAAGYTAQLAAYAEGVRRLWPDANVRAVVLFTAIPVARAVQVTAVNTDGPS